MYFAIVFLLKISFFVNTFGLCLNATYAMPPPETSDDGIRKLAAPKVERPIGPELLHFFPSLFSERSIQPFKLIQ